MTIKLFRGLLVAMAIMTLLLSACRNKRVLTGHGRKVDNLSTGKLIDSISQHCFHFNYFSSKISTEVHLDNEDNSFKINLRMRQDSAIWVALSKVNIVGYTAIITMDSVKVMDKLKKKYFAGNFSYINDMLDTELDYYMIQDILVGNLINFDPKAKYKTREDTAYYYISTVGKRRLKKAFENERIQKKEPYIYRYWINPGTYRPARMIINDISDTTTLDVEYKSYEWVDSVLVPAEMKVIISRPGKEAVLELNFSRTKVNEFTEFPFNIPDGYEKVE